jgi:hypothetical protein
MFNKIKDIFKKAFGGNSWISLFWFLWNNKALEDNDYVKFFQSWQYAAITAISDSLSSLEYRLAWSDDKDLKHEYFNFVSPDLLANIATFMKLCWTAYVWKVMLWWKVLGLSILLPWNISPIIDWYGNLEWWNYYWTWEGWWMRLWVDEVLVFAEFNPFERYPYITRGYSPLQALAMTLWWEKEIEKWNYSLLSNDVPPWMVLTTDQSLTVEQVKWIKETWERNHSWATNVWKIAILPFWIKPSSFQASPKEMEFISQQERDRDKILAIYKVPKAVLWIGEGVNVWNVKAFNQVFSSRCIAPLAKKIARVFNDWLFKWIGTFEFLNVLPTDEDQVREHYLSWWITKNEYRIELWYKPVEGWDVFIDWSECKVKSEVADSSSGWVLDDFDFKSIVRKNIPFSDEWNKERIKNRDKRLVKYEKLLREGLLKIFTKQENDLLKLVSRRKFYSHSKDLFSFLWKKYYSLYYVVLKEAVIKILKSEWDRALVDINKNEEFNVDDPVVVEGIKELLKILASSVDWYTEEKIDNKISGFFDFSWDRGDWNWTIISVDDLKDIIEEVYDELKNKRIETIVRTESVRYSNYAEDKAWSMSWEVKYKKWVTAEDDKRCIDCVSLNWIKVWVKDEFKKWVLIPPLHPNCRCGISPG